MAAKLLAIAITNQLGEVMEALLDRGERWAIILAGGDGRRLDSLTRRITGRETPKQFCAVLGEDTLLESTLRRVRPLTPSGRTLTVVTRKHEHFYSRLELGPAFNLVVQPENRGTAPAILYALSRIARVSVNATVAIFPSDHYFGSDARFVRYVGMAADAVDARPELALVLGVPPSAPETGYGWIEPGFRIDCANAKAEIQTIRRFWEKPASDLARQFLRSGYLWNTFVIVGRVSTLLGAFMICAPALYREFFRVRSALGTLLEENAAAQFYRNLEPSGFSEQVLAKCPPNLATLPMHGVEWSDLGEPKRVLAALSRAGLHLRWAAA